MFKELGNLTLLCMGVRNLTHGGGGGVKNLNQFSIGMEGLTGCGNGRDLGVCYKFFNLVC